MPRPPQQLAGRIWVGSVTLLIAFIAYSSQIFIIWPWYGRELTIELVQLLLPFNLLVAFLYWNYFLCVYTDPGTVPQDWEPNPASEEGFELKMVTGAPRYCRHCEQYKPPRAHHCRKCKKCVLRMDHHCPWTDNCIGHFNYAHFLRFLWAVDIACSYHIAMLSYRVWYAILYPYWEPSGFELAFIVGNYVACLPVLVAVGVFSLYHFYCLLTNTTTVEGWEKDKVTTLVRRGKITEVEFPYNLGVVGNVKSVFGGNLLLWCWPRRRIIGDGLKFTVGPGTDESKQYSWPPKDPFREQPTTRELPSSPWTFGNEDVNPALKPTGSRLKTTNVPPYHPSYRSSYPDDVGSDGSRSTSSSPDRESHSSNEYIPYPSQQDGAEGPRHRDGWREEQEDEGEPVQQRHGMRMRRGSEGWEATMPDRWAQLQMESGIGGD